jgi:uncharacterized circularly permuted ATP-grasp superfamily protein
MLLNIFDVMDPIVIDNGIQRYEYHAYEPEFGTNLNISGEIRMHVTNKDAIVHPAGSYLLVEGRLKKNDGTAYAAADKVTLINNGIMYLFDSIKRQLSEKTIEQVNHPGQATTMLGLLKYCTLEHSLWHKG